MTPKARPSQVIPPEEAKRRRGGAAAGGWCPQKSAQVFLRPNGRFPGVDAISREGKMCVRGIGLPISHFPNSVQVEAPDEI